MQTSKLLSPARLGALNLSNHIVMAPMTRSRATADHIPTPIMADYYRQRASVGLIITEGVSPSADGAGYARIPGIYTQAQIDGWKAVTKAVHAEGGRIFVQLMHTGRVGHPLNLEAGAEIVAPSAIAIANEQMWTDSQGMQPFPTPRAIATAEIPALIEQYVTAAKNAIAAGFDGVELHGANGYLIEQFLRPSSNQRTDAYGGSTENYARFALEVAQAVAAAIGKEKVGIRLSPYGVFNEMPYDPAYDAIYRYLVAELSKLELVYLHIVNHHSMGAPAVDETLVRDLRKSFGGAFILSGGYDAARAEADLNAGLGDLVAFGRPIIANPDFAARIRTGAELAAPDFGSFYTPGEKGYTDYPTLAEVAA